MACLLFWTSLNLFSFHVKQETKGIFNNNLIQSQCTLFSVCLFLLPSLPHYICHRIFYTFLVRLSLSKPLILCTRHPNLVLASCCKNSCRPLFQIFGLGMGSVLITYLLQILWPLAETCLFWPSVPHHLSVIGLLERLHCPRLHSEM